MNLKKCNLIAGGLFLILAAFGGFALGYTIDPLVTDGFYKMSFSRLLLKGAHSHGMLFGLFNLIIGILISKLALEEKGKKWLSISGLLSLILPIGLLLRGFTYPSNIFLPLGAIGGISFVIAGILIMSGSWKLKKLTSNDK